MRVAEKTHAAFRRMAERKAFRTAMSHRDVVAETAIRMARQNCIFVESSRKAVINRLDNRFDSKQQTKTN